MWTICIVTKQLRVKRALQIQTNQSDLLVDCLSVDHVFAENEKANFFSLCGEVSFLIGCDDIE